LKPWKEIEAMYAPTWSAGSENLASYLRDIKSFPMLSAEEEFALSRAWRDNRDHRAAQKLVTSHLRLVARIAMGYRGYGLPLGDLIGEGTVGMMQAVERFDPDRGFRLATYAMWWIRASIQEYVMRSWSLVKLGTTSAQKRLFFNLRRLKAQMQAIDDGELHPGQVTAIAHALRVAEHDVVSTSRRMSARDHSLNTPLTEDAEDQWQDRLEDGSDSQEVTLAEQEELSDRRALLGRAFKVLKERERHILIERRLKEQPLTLEALSRHYNVSRERIRQIEVRAMGRLRHATGVETVARASRTRRATAAPGAIAR
jgi:RNA polymerase sigma-32 factor